MSAGTKTLVKRFRPSGLGMTVYKYASRMPVHADPADLTPAHIDLLTKSDTFCMLPWIHLHAFPDGRAYPCCNAEYIRPVGNLKKESMADIWNNAKMRNMRRNMLENRPCKECTKCYEQEKSGFTSSRHNHSQNFGHNIALVDETGADGRLDRFELRYYDIRFSNICNFRCRSCGSIFSSNWHSDEQKLNGTNDQPKIIYAGKTEDDMWEQMQEHIPHLDQIYFAGGEPLIMEEHYRILNELVKRKMFHVRLVYNTNFSRLQYKDQDVLKLWRQFDSVGVGASLDGSWARGEYIRKGTDWQHTLDNRRRMQKECPGVQFHINCTVSIFNALHITDFHRELVKNGFVSADGININIVQHPLHYRIDVLPPEIKSQVRQKIEQHLEWLRPLDNMERATNGFESMIKFMEAEEKQNYLPKFFELTHKLDVIRNENFYDVFPELAGLKTYDKTQ